MSFRARRDFARLLGTGGPSGQRGVAKTAAESFRPVRVNREELAELLEFVEQEEELLVQRLSGLEARSLQTQPELFAKTIGTLTPDPPTMPAAALLPLEPPTTFVTYGEL
jgi:hypothetical protein